jgi:hypothetical protein
MAVRSAEHLSLRERRARGRQAREATPVSAHDGWVPAPRRPDPVKLLEDQNERDYLAFADAVQTGRITALEGV